LSESKEREAGFIPTRRLEALTDAVFAFALTLLVINIELPESFHPKTDREFLHGLLALSDTFTAYLITFAVLVSFWLGRARVMAREPEMASPAFAWATLFHLLGVTFLPFSMLTVSRYGFATAVWIYSANMILLAVTALATSRIAERDGRSAHIGNGRVELGILILSAILSMIVSLSSPGNAMMPYLLNLATPFVKRAVSRR
jgi:uncharacterized membrane protein